MSLATTFEEKNRIINDIWSKMAPDERKIMLKKAIKDDLKAYFEVIWDEQKFLEKESGVEAVCEYTSEKAWSDGEEIQPEDTGLEVNLAGKVSKEAENAYYFDEKRAKKAGNDRFDGFLGYVNSSGNDENESKFIQISDETVLEPDENQFTSLENSNKIEEI